AIKEIIPGRGRFGAAAETGIVMFPGRPVAANDAFTASRTTPVFPAEGTLTKFMKYGMVPPYSWCMTLPLF
ncbi:MAG: hypothetical protein CL694_12015, partial [Chloroflexi bacterium]|nr:hypothetical protein [Chloroflexota bacterium]